MYDKVLKKNETPSNSEASKNTEEKEDNSPKIYITRNGVRTLEKAPENLSGKYVNNEFADDYFILYSDGSAESKYVLGDSEDNTKDYFSKNELKYEIVYQNSNKLILKFIPNDSQYRDYFNDLDGSISNGMFEFTPTVPSPVSNPGQTKYIKK